MTGSSGKRKRDPDEDDEELMPQAKRVNRLDINYEDIHWNDNGSIIPMAPPSSGSIANQSAQQQYNSNLNQVKNTFYIAANKILYELNKERLKRHPSH